MMKKIIIIIFGLFLLSPTLSTASAIVCPDIPTNTSWWKADGNANDFYGNNNGEMKNGATFSTGMVSQAFSLDGKDDFVSVPDSASLDTTDGLTIEGWFKANAYNPSGNSALISKLGNQNERSYSLFIDSAGKLYFLTSSSGNAGMSITGPTLPLNQWVHIAAVKDSDSTYAWIYVNGELVSSGNVEDPIRNSNAPLTLGTYYTIQKPIDFFNGLIDEVGVYGYALTSSEIKDIFDARTVPNITADTDKDGITDDIDSCPTQPETINGYKDSDGCADTTQPTDIPTQINYKLTNSFGPFCDMYGKYYKSDCIDPDGHLGPLEPGDGGLNLPSGIQVFKNKLYVADRGNNRIQILDLSGNFVAKFGFAEYGSASPSDIAVNNAGAVYAVYPSNLNIKIFDSTGSSVYNQFSTKLSGNSDNSTPELITISKLENLYIIERGTNQIKIFDVSESYIPIYISSFGGHDEFKNPSGINSDTFGNVYVSDNIANNVNVFDSEGKLLYKFGTSGSNDGQFNRPGGIAVDNDKIYVVDTGNKRIQIFDLKGKYLATVGKGELTSPTDVTVDDNGVLYVLDSKSIREKPEIKAFAPSNSKSNMSITSVQPQQTEHQVPDWVKNNAGWWADGQIDDAAFSKGVQFLVKEEIIQIPNLPKATDSKKDIPIWVKNNAEWWSQGLITESDFVKGLEYMIKNEIIRVD